MQFKSKYIYFIFFICISLLSCKGQSGSHADPTKKITEITIPEPEGWVNDFAFLYDLKQKTILDSSLEAFEKKTSIQIAVFTFTKAMLKTENIDEYTLKVANRWRVGQKGKNNGVLVGICGECHSMRIQNGFGIEKVLSDDETKLIIDSSFIPYFKKNDFFTGTVSGLKAIMQKLERNQ